MTEKTVDGLVVLSNVLETFHKDELRKMLEKSLIEVMEAEVSKVCGAGLHERNEERQTHRNGYRERLFETRLGAIELAIPKPRQGSYMPSFLEPRRRWEKGFVNVVCEAYVNGVSVRKVDRLVKAMGATGMSKSEVSRVAEVLDAEVQEFLTRPIDTWCPYLWLDAIYLKVREGSRVVSKAVLVAYGVTESGYRQVLGLEVADGEMEDSWQKFLAGLIQRGLKGVMLAISDAHVGLKNAIRNVLVGASWQRCSVHFRRNVLSRVHKHAQGWVAAALKQAFAQQNGEEAKEAMGKVIDMLNTKFPAAAAIVEGAEDDVLAYMAYPKEHWRQLHSTNPLERLNKEIRRRTDVVGIFPSGKSTLRLVGTLLMEQNDEWLVGRRYFSLGSIEKLRHIRRQQLPQPGDVPGEGEAANG